MSGPTEGPPPRAPLYGPYLTIGIQLAATVVVFFFIGRWLDGQFGTDPWLMLAGRALGVGGGLTAFLKSALTLGKEEDRDAKERKKGSGGESEK